eukprot:CAMPEP_0172568378 /NCGR_PEP_ID=MMETSP1067-20121228/119764_1 /TAXON_ID=265564 ORGANISM="Thalassiosira punctigera, Strain Tpunct2005C2" /NCGR_SAMPLE_ID=MMETSP1067 /ASSEMBLY_ACC=CAM_ASM_000444 /LENGTH=133 /DNA_ID=CAMNT_0013359965 /DNA_START=156 /DNA_END=553 /DNA_ORIENTATION=-
MEVLRSRTLGARGRVPKRKRVSVFLTVGHYSFFVIGRRPITAKYLAAGVIGRLTNGSPESVWGTAADVHVQRNGQKKSTVGLPDCGLWETCAERRPFFIVRIRTYLKFKTDSLPPFFPFRSIGNRRLIVNHVG